MWYTFGGNWNILIKNDPWISITHKQRAETTTHLKMYLNDMRLIWGFFLCLFTPQFAIYNIKIIIMIYTFKKRITLYQLKFNFSVLQTFAISNSLRYSISDARSCLYNVRVLWECRINTFSQSCKQKQSAQSLIAVSLEKKYF